MAELLAALLWLTSITGSPAVLLADDGTSCQGEVTSMGRATFEHCDMLPRRDTMLYVLADRDEDPVDWAVAHRTEAGWAVDFGTDEPMGWGEL
jgi:hypothetical protein